MDGKDRRKGPRQRVIELADEEVERDAVIEIERQAEEDIQGREDPP